MREQRQYTLPLRGGGGGSGQHTLALACTFLAPMSSGLANDLLAKRWRACEAHAWRHSLVGGAERHSPRLQRSRTVSGAMASVLSTSTEAVMAKARKASLAKESDMSAGGSGWQRVWDGVAVVLGRRRMTRCWAAGPPPPSGRSVGRLRVVCSRR